MNFHTTSPNRRQSRWYLISCQGNHITVFLLITYHFRASDQNGNISPGSRRSTISRSSSIDSISGETFIGDYFSSDELDKLSTALSEVSITKKFRKCEIGVDNIANDTVNSASFSAFRQFSSALFGSLSEFLLRRTLVLSQVYLWVDMLQTCAYSRERERGGQSPGG